jgi:hypothetical protein
MKLESLQVPTNQVHQNFLNPQFDNSNQAQKKKEKRFVLCIWNTCGAYINKYEFFYAQWNLASYLNMF